MNTGLPAGTTDQAGQTNFNNAKSDAEKKRTSIYNSLKTVNWGSFQTESGLELKDGNVDNFNLGQVEAYCSENGAVVRKCTERDLNCFQKHCSCSKKEGTITKCSEYINHKILQSWNMPFPQGQACGQDGLLLTNFFSLSPSFFFLPFFMDQNEFEVNKKTRSISRRIDRENVTNIGFTI